MAAHSVAFVPELLAPAPEHIFNMQTTGTQNMKDNTTTCADIMERELPRDVVRPCGNPQCRRLFKPRSKYRPDQIYCGCGECDRSRQCQRSRKHRLCKLHGRTAGAASSGATPVSREETVAVNVRLLWLLAGLALARQGTDERLAATLERTIAAGRRACGGANGVRILQSVLFTMT